MALTDKELRNLRREELIELLNEETRENERLRSEIDYYKQLLRVNADERDEGTLRMNSFINTMNETNKAMQSSQEYVDIVVRQMDGLMVESQHRASSILEKARNDSSVMLADANKESSKILDDAHTVAGSIIEEANNRSDKILEDANSRSNEIIEKAENRSMRIISDGQQAADQITLSANRNADEIISQAKNRSSGFVREEIGNVQIMLNVAFEQILKYLNGLDTNSEEGGNESTDDDDSTESVKAETISANEEFDRTDKKTADDIVREFDDGFERLDEEFFGSPEQ